MLTAKDIADRLRELDEVHSLKIRIKDPEHLIEKIIRKRRENPTVAITLANYRDVVTDLIGIRALHLFKDDWIPIHDFVVRTWELSEPPTANVRKGDSDDYISRLQEKECEIKEHAFGYRSVHYLLKSQLTKDLFIAELQVRTIFEEGWSEIDHRIRYPYDQNNPVLGQFLVIFNRLAGSADEMGTFIKFLKRELEDREMEYNAEASKFKESIAGLEADFQKLHITKQQKDELESRLKSLSNVQPRFQRPRWIVALDNFFKILESIAHAAIEPEAVTPLEYPNKTISAPSLPLLATSSHIKPQTAVVTSKPMAFGADSSNPKLRGRGVTTRPVRRERRKKTDDSGGSPKK